MSNASLLASHTHDALPAPLRLVATGTHDDRSRAPRSVVAAPFHQQVSRLMTRYVEGDASAFHALYTMMRPRLARLCGAMVGAADEQDVLQEVFLKLHRARHTFVRDGNAVAWSYAIARTTCVDRLRDPSRSRELAMDHEQLDAQGCTKDEDDGSIKDALLQRLGELSPCVRDAYLLVKLEGLRCDEAARALGISTSAVKQRVHRATVELRRELRESAATRRIGDNSSACS